MAIRDYSQTPASNTTISGINVDEGCNPSTINNAIRQLMADARELQAGSTVTAGATTSIGASNTIYVSVPGTTTITAFDTVAAGVLRVIKFTEALTLTHNGTSLIIPGGANITTAAGDTMVVMSEGSGNWRVISYQRANGAPLSLATAQATTTYIADSAVTAAKIADGAVTKDKLGLYSAGTIISYAAGGTATSIESGTTGQVLTSNGAGILPSFQASTDVFSASYSSGDNGISAGASLSLTHSLGAVPKLIVAKLKCTDAGGEGGYAQNDEVFIPVTGMTDSAFAYGVNMWADATTIYGKMGSLSTPFFLLNKTTGNVFNCTNAKWALLVRAYA